MLNAGDIVGITACSDPILISAAAEIQTLCEVLTGFGLTPLLSSCLYGGTSAERAAALHALYQNADVKMIFDVSGGDLAGELPDLLDYRLIAKNKKPLVGYSDLTCILNAVFAKTGSEGLLWQAKNLVCRDAERQKQLFQETFLSGGDAFFQPKVQFLRGSRMEGTLIGGNIRCFLKLAGTPYLPSFEGKILLLEAFGGGPNQLRSMFCQLRQMGAFEKIAGVLLGTFTWMEENRITPAAEELFLETAKSMSFPVARTGDIGHADSALMLPVGGKLSLTTSGAMISTRAS